MCNHDVQALNGVHIVSTTLDKKVIGRILFVQNLAVGVTF